MLEGFARLHPLLRVQDGPAPVRFLSCEPLLGALNLDNTVDWVIAGGESGPEARPSHPDWLRLLRDQCLAAHVPFFFKQWGEWRLKQGQDGNEGHGQHRSPIGVLDVDGSWHRDTYNPTGDDWRPGCAGWNGNPQDEVTRRVVMALLGKHAAGRLLDGVEHNGRPACDRLARWRTL